MSWIILLLIAMLACGLIAFLSRSPQRREREEQYEQRFGPLSF